MPQTPNSHTLHANIFHLDDDTYAAPGAGNDFTDTPPARSISELVHLHVHLITDANAANRFVHIYGTLTAATTTLAMIPAAITASKSVHIQCIQGINQYSVTGLDYIFLPLPPGILWTDTDTIHIQNIAKQAGDTLISIKMLWKIWPSR